MNKLLSLLLLLNLSNLPAQSIKSRGVFLSDSMKLGANVKYYLTVRHEANLQILFPDSGYNFSPFELIRKDFFPTKTINGTSLDSAVYELRSFELKSIQKLSLPIFIMENNDTLSLYAKADSIILKEYLPETPVHADFKEDVAFFNISKDINYSYILFYLSIIILTFSIIYFFFGKVIRKRYRLFIIRLDHNTFLKNFQKLHEDFTSNQAPAVVEKTLTVWKAYLARLDNKSINTYTTTEIIDLYNHEELKDGLNIIDKAIYGGVISMNTEKAIIVLRRFSVRQYHKRKREIKNA